MMLLVFLSGAKKGLIHPPHKIFLVAHQRDLHHTSVTLTVSGLS